MSVEGRPSGRASMAVPERIVYQGEFVTGKIDLLNFILN